MAGWVCGPGVLGHPEQALTPVDRAPDPREEPQASGPGLKLSVWDASAAKWGTDSRQGWACASSGLLSLLYLHKQAGPKHHLFLSEPQFTCLPKSIMMTTTFASEGWGLGSKESWTENVLSRQKQAHTAITPEWQNSTALTLQSAGDFIFARRALAFSG